MNKIIFVLLLSAFSLFGAEVKWEKDLSSAVQRADKEHKPLMVLVTKNGCRWCDIFKQKTLTNPKVVAILNRDFVVYEGVVDEGSVPPSLMTQGTPATWFIKGKTPMFEPIMGAAESGDFLEALDIVKQEYKKNATNK
ncbi:MAG: thioredoxin family protein [Sulfuricurvum sp.]|uniref:thioredoxin family protein n=1 Tax=Sulfuricurvum sp. TaxID=2025608 RepID=UPI0025CFF194|nr:thioredoxin family protein [Sulfuricurvum sp.]MBV5320594.1 thioredoxin family protein [Sulfuricurvum sp.]